MTILVALAVTVASLLAASAAGEWQQGLRDQIKSAGAMVEDVRFVYGDEAPVGLELALAGAGARAPASRGGDAETEHEAITAEKRALHAEPGWV